MPAQFRPPSRILISLALAMTPSAVAQAEPAGGADPCSAPQGAIATIRTVSDLGDIHLTDGRIGRLADLDLGADAMPAARWAGHLAAIRQAMSATTVRVVVAPSGRDRWGRDVWRMEPVGGDATSVHRALVKAGLARVWPLQEEESCAASLLGSESEARRGGLGLWGENDARIRLYRGAGGDPCARGPLCYR
ncbi:MAG: thermonuclease family protein [Beijerinckiaceae bacterium]